MTAPRAVELFAGCGGAALGLQRAGFQAQACVELDGSACATLMAAGFPAVQADIRTMAYPHDWCRPDLLWASPPCQPWSRAGLRLGEDDPRNGWPWTIRAIDHLAPIWFMAENVPGMADKRGMPYLVHVLAELRSRFAFVDWRILNAADAGVPQHRRRVIIVAGPAEYRWPAPTHAEVPQGGLLPWRTIRDALPDLCAGSALDTEQTSDRRDQGRKRHTASVEAPAPTVRAGTPERSRGAPVAVFVRHEGGDALARDVAREPAPAIGTKGTLYAHPEDPGAWKTGACLASAGRDASGEIVYAQGFGRAATEPERLDRPAPSVAASEAKGTNYRRSGDGPQGGPPRASDGAFLAVGRRRLTPDELAALQSFPPGYPFQGGKTAVYCQIGNACAPPMVEALGRALLEIHDG